MEKTGGTTTKRGVNVMKTGLGMLVFGVIIAIATAGENGNPGLNAFASVVALAGFITLLIGVSKYRERPAGD
jgi:phosphotransferase system  glucose/maltose/N-acetylglucosamine-specific IIC component